MSGDGLTAYDVAKFIGMSPTGRINAWLDELVAVGFLQSATVEHRPKVTKKIYWMNPDIAADLDTMDTWLSDESEYFQFG
jgi:hypothetical protein